MNLCRIITRENENGKVDLMIGIGRTTHNSTLFQPNKVYDLKEYNGMIVLVEVGDTCIPQSFKEDVNNIGISWASEINDILLSGKHIWLTEDEFKRYQSSKENS